MVQAGALEDGKLKVIDRTDTIPNPAYVVRGDLPESLKAKLKRIFFSIIRMRVILKKCMGTLPYVLWMSAKRIIRLFMILWKRCILKENKKMDKVLLHIEHLTKRYDKDTVALRNVEHRL